MQSTVEELVAAYVITRLKGQRKTKNIFKIGGVPVEIQTW
jgi:hypothetical protein